MIEHEPAGVDRVDHLLLQGTLGEPAAAGHHRPLQRLLGHARQHRCRGDVIGEIVGTPGGREAGDQRRRRDHRGPELLEQLHHAARHPVEVRHGIVGGHFHGDTLARHHASERLVQLFPPRIRDHAPGEAGHRLHLDPVRHRDRFTGAQLLIPLFYCLNS